MTSEKKWFGSIVAILSLSLFLLNGCGEKTADKAAGDAAKTETAAAGDQGIGLPMYPDAKQDPEFPLINTPQMKNIHLLTGDSFDKVVEWYTQKLGAFDVDKQPGGSQALWSKDTDDGFFMTTTISTIKAPAGKVAITMTKGKVKQ
jgi:hypothetical protein